MASKTTQIVTVPEGFNELLETFTAEILRNQPLDIVDFSVEYFKCLHEGLVLDYPQKGQNIPCDFKPRIPKVPDILSKKKGSSQ